MLNLRNFSWTNPLAVRQEAQDSESESELSDEEIFNSTKDSSRVDRKSPAEVNKAIFESDNRSESKYKPTMQLSPHLSLL